MSDLGYKWEVGPLPDGISGQLNPNERLITINSFDWLDRRRFTLAHEYAHVIQLTSVKDMKIFSCQSQEPAADDETRAYREHEADWFAASLLLPTGPLIKFLANSIAVFPSEEYLVNQVGEKFNVSRSTAAKRLYYLYFALISPGYLYETTL